MKEIILINITGKDKPGLTASLTHILAQYEVTILDIGQAVIHDYLSLGILVDIPSAYKSASILKDLLFQAHELGIQIRFSAIDETGYQEWAAKYGRENRAWSNASISRLRLAPSARATCSAGSTWGPR